MIDRSRVMRELTDGHDDKVVAALDLICEVLPRTNEYPIWSDGEEILCADEQTADKIGDLIDMMYGDTVVNTGYYDPEEDALVGCVDDLTGFYYVTID